MNLGVLGKIIGVVFALVAVAQLAPVLLLPWSSLRFGSIYISETTLVQIGIMLVAGLVGVALLRSRGKDEAEFEPADAEEWDG